MVWLCSQIYWFLENGFNFSAHLLVPLCVLTGWAVWRRSWRLLTVGVMGIGVGLTALVYSSRHMEYPDAGAAGTPLRVMTFNVLSGNERYQDTRRYVRAQNPDILIVTETNPSWALELRELEDLFPHTGRAGRTGIMILSKHPLSEGALWVADKWVKEIPAPDYWGTRDRLIRGVRYRVDINGQPFALIGVHVSRPSSTRLLHKRDQEFEILTARLDRETLPVILGGDFNASSLSPAFSIWANRNRMRGVNPYVIPPVTTYPVWAPGLGIQIDHILIRGPMAWRGYWAGPGMGSNHRPLTVDIAVTSQARAGPDGIAQQPVL